MSELQSYFDFAARLLILGSYQLTYIVVTKRTAFQRRIHAAHPTGGSMVIFGPVEELSKQANYRSTQAALHGFYVVSADAFPDQPNEIN